MGAHKGKKYGDHPSKQRYWSQNHRRTNKMRRILRCNGQAFLDAWKAKYVDSTSAGSVRLGKMSVGGNASAGNRR